MTSVETNSNDWRELRLRVDSIAHAIFPIAGGALSLSTTVNLGQRDEITEEVVRRSTQAWYALSASMILFFVLKVHLVLAAYLLQFRSQFVNKHLRVLNGIGWIVGILGFAAFIQGLILIVAGAAMAVGA